MKDLNKNRKGYKNTQVGWIPDDWELSKLKTFGEVITGNTPPTIDKVNYGNEFCFVSPVDLGNNKYITDSKNKLSIVGFSKARRIPKGSILFVCIGSTIGKCGIAGKDLSFNQQINAIIVNDLNCNEFLFYELFNKVNSIRILAGTQAVPIINKSLFENIVLLKPPTLEQQNISRILAIWDKVIDATENLIAAKKQLKKGLMQQLLTGKKRLQGFNSEWKTKPFEAVFEFVRTEAFSWEELTYSNNEGSILYIHYGDIHATFENQILDVNNDVLPYLKDVVLSNKEFSYLQNGDLVIADASEDYEGVAECIELSNVNNRKVIGGLHTIVARDKSKLTVPGYRAYIFKNPDISLELKKIATGTSVYSISKSTLTKLKIPLPSIEEQKIMARIFSNIDKEINLLKSQLELYRRQKKGLMQILLTGAVRVKI